MRRAYHCPCDGQSNRWRGEVAPQQLSAATVELDAAERLGDRPAACPWWGFYDADVRAVHWAYRFWESGLEHAWGSDPEWWLVQAVAYWHRALQQSRALVGEKPKPPTIQSTENSVNIRG